MHIRSALLAGTLAVTLSSAIAVDPARIWATYYGGSGLDEVHSTAVDAAGNVYIAGTSWSQTGIAFNGHQNSLGGPGARDAFLAKFSPTGTRIWATYFGGELPEVGYCAVDQNGNVYLAGWTFSPSGIALNGHQNSPGGARDAFLAKFDGNGALLWSTYFGGSGDDRAFAVATDIWGSVWLAGSTTSTSGIAFSGYQNTFGGTRDAFLARFNVDGTLIWSTYLGGALTEEALGLTVHASGGAYICGLTNSPTDMATMAPAHGGGNDAFVARFSSTGLLIFCRYIGGAGSDRALGCVATDGLHMYVTGTTGSTSGIALNGPQMTFGGGVEDAFLVKLNSTGQLQWGTYHGGLGTDVGQGIAMDGAGRIYINGSTLSVSGIASGGYQNTYGGGGDAFLAKYTNTATRLWATYYGGSAGEGGYACAVEPTGDVYLAGITNSATGIAFSGHQMVMAGGDSDGMLVRLAGSTPTAAVSIRMILGGAYSVSLMRDDLRIAGLIPANEPYAALGYDHINNTSGTVQPVVFSVTGNNAIVDWVVVELRDAVDPASRLITRSALLRRTGDVVDTDGVSAIFFDIAPGAYHVAIRHRNHLGVMTATPFALGQIPTLLNFNSASTGTFGTDARTAIGGLMALWAGDATGNGQLRYTGAGNDRDPILLTVGSTTPNGTVSNVYDRRDTNLDGVIKYTGAANDRDIILTNVGSTTPNNTRTQQLP